MEFKSSGGLMPDYRASVTKRKEFLVNNELMSDVVFLVGKNKQKIYAHKQLLAAASDYFYVMFEGNFRESKAGEIALEDIEWPILKEILRYMYCGKADLTMENIREMFIHTQKYMLWELLDEISDFLLQHVTPGNALEMLKQNRIYELPAVDDACTELIGDNPLHYFSTEDFVKIDYGSLDVIVKSSKGFNCTDTQLLNALQVWQKANPSADKKELETYIERSVRAYHCLRLQVHGKSNHVNRESFMALEVDVCSKPVSLYGIGVFARSQGTIKIRIHVNYVCICDRSYVVDKHESTEIADCFFRKLELEPSRMYTFTLSGDGVNLQKTLVNAEISDSRILSLSGGQGSKIACFYFNSEPFFSRKRKRTN